MQIVFTAVGYIKLDHLSSKMYYTDESVPTQQRERMVLDPVNQYQKP